MLVREKLGPLMTTLIDHGVAHPLILFGGIGDHHSDSYPLRVGQFESGMAELLLTLSRPAARRPAAVLTSWRAAPDSTRRIISSARNRVRELPV